MPNITFIHADGKQTVIDAEEGLSLMESARKNNIKEIEGACGGSLACATCHLYVHPNWWQRCLPPEGKRTPEEEDMLDLAFDVRKK